MRKLTLVVFLVFANFCFSASPEKSAVVIAVEYKSGAHGTGSGTVISNKDKESLIITNRHVVENGKNVYIISEGKLVVCEIININEDEDDLAVIKVKKDIPAAKISDKDTELGDDISHLGHTSGPQKGKSGGLVIISKDATSPKYIVMISDMLSIPGDSGGGIFNKDGDLVGVNFGRFGPMDGGLEAGVPISSVKKFLEKIEGWKFFDETPKK